MINTLRKQKNKCMANNSLSLLWTLQKHWYIIHNTENYLCHG